MKRLLIALVACLSVLVVGCSSSEKESAVTNFLGENSYSHVVNQTDMGPRYPGSEGHTEVKAYILDELKESGWKGISQDFIYNVPNGTMFPGENLIGKANIGKGPIIILGAHYDTRAVSDQSPDQAQTPTLGAVDGASGVAVLLELADSLDLEKIDREIWLAFFDLEDNGKSGPVYGINGWDWIVGSSYMAENLVEIPEAMVLVDMIGDADQDMYLEGNSDQTLQGELWAIADELGYSAQFISKRKYTMTDDHVPFKNKGIPAVDIIDFDYAHWHKITDTADKVAPESLERVGRVIETWLEEKIDLVE